MLRMLLCSKMRFIAQFQLCKGHLNFRNRLFCRPVNVKLCQPLVLQIKAMIYTNISQSLLDLLLLDLAALYDTDGFFIRAVVNLLLLTQKIAFIPVLDFNICITGFLLLLQPERTPAAATARAITPALFKKLRRVISVIFLHLINCFVSSCFPLRVSAKDGWFVMTNYSLPPAFCQYFSSMLAFINIISSFLSSVYGFFSHFFISQTCLVRVCRRIQIPCAAPAAML